MENDTISLDPSVANHILEWAQLKLDAMKPDEFGDDWWGAYNESLDVNIWYNALTSKICVTVYPIIATGESESLTDTSNFIRLGNIDVAVRNYDNEDCAECCRKMDVKWGSTYPHRYDDSVVCGLCWNKLTYGEII